MPEKVKFTKHKIDSLPLPEASPDGKTSRLEYQDTEINGLTLRVTAKGVKTFAVLRWCKSSRKTERITIGRYPEVTIEQARKKAQIYNEQIVAGLSPAEAIRKKKEELTLSDMFQIYLERHAFPHKKTHQEDVRDFDNHLRPSFGKKRLSDITKNDIAKLHTKVGEIKPRTANKVLALLSTIFGRAIAFGFTDMNPAKGIKRFPEVKRGRFLYGDELIRFFEALKNLSSETMRDFFLMCLLTGARRSNVMSMRWEQIDLHNKLWRIPMTKNGNPQTLPLMNEAISILERRKEISSSPWVFPSSTSKTGHIVEPKKAWLEIQRQAELTDFRIHDLRRTMGSWQLKTGSSTGIIGRTLNHKSPQATQIYTHLDVEGQRESMEKAMGALFTEAKGKKYGKE